METKLVSVIIPCFNAERWIGEAIESCLQQTYPRIEVIVVDDGSTDSSLDIIKSFRGAITWKTGVNCGGNHARNLGFSLSQGEYIQYLDSDDYLLPDKIAQQVNFLEETQSAIVYGDVRYQHHLPQGEIYQEEALFPGIAGKHTDFLESLLAYGCLPPMAYLFRQEIIAHSPGWDESLRAAQDRDFLISLMISNPTAKVRYQPRSDSIYRRYGKVTVSTSSMPRLVKSFCRVLSKAESKLRECDRLSGKYIKAMADSYYTMSQNYKEDISSSLYQYIIKRYLLMSSICVKDEAHLLLSPGTSDPCFSM
jgi:glycosyltransferase involved in cell wall biosynthesis